MSLTLAEIGLTFLLLHQLFHFVHAQSYALFIYLFIYLFIVLRFQTSYNNCIKEAGTPQQLNTNYSGPFTKYQKKYRKIRPEELDV